jgi:hypothetical protein
MTIADDDNCALNDNRTLKDASQIEWHYDPDDPSPMAQGGSSGGPVGTHALLSAVMFHIILTSEILLMHQRPLLYTATALSVTAVDFAINATTTSISAVTAATVVIITTIAAIFNIATTFTVSAAIIIITAAISIASAIFTATAAVSVSSASASNRSPHSVNLVRSWSYHPMAPFPQSVTSI